MIFHSFMMQTLKQENSLLVFGQLEHLGELRTPAMSKKPRKPRLINLAHSHCYLFPKGSEFPLRVHGLPLTLKEAKRLYEWIGKALKYLEWRKG